MVKHLPVFEVMKQLLSHHLCAISIMRPRHSHVRWVFLWLLCIAVNPAQASEFSVRGSWQDAAHFQYMTLSDSGVLQNGLNQIGQQERQNLTHNNVVLLSLVELEPEQIPASKSQGNSEDVANKQSERGGEKVHKSGLSELEYFILSNLILFVLSFIVGFGLPLIEQAFGINLMPVWLESLLHKVHDLIFLNRPWDKK